MAWRERPPVPKLHVGMFLFAKLHFAPPGHGPGEEKRRHGRTHSKTGNIPAAFMTTEFRPERHHFTYDENGR